MSDEKTVAPDWSAIPEFRDFDNIESWDFIRLALPGAVDKSWHNDACPSLQWCGLEIFVGWRDEPAVTIGIPVPDPAEGVTWVADRNVEFEAPADAVAFCRGFASTFNTDLGARGRSEPCQMGRLWGGRTRVEFDAARDDAG